MTVVRHRPVALGLIWDHLPEASWWYPWMDTLRERAAADQVTDR